MAGSCATSSAHIFNGEPSPVSATRPQNVGDCIVKRALERGEEMERDVPTGGTPLDGDDCIDDAPARPTCRIRPNASSGPNSGNDSKDSNTPLDLSITPSPEPLPATPPKHSKHASIAMPCKSEAASPFGAGVAPDGVSVRDGCTADDTMTIKSKPARYAAAAA